MSHARSVWVPRLSAAALIALVTALRLVYLAWYSPFDLAPDEAHYWDWSRHLDWSYYSKGPLVALLIRASCEVFGPLSIALTGGETLAVRLPAVACGAMLLAALYVLTTQVWRREIWSLGVVALSLTFPMIAAGAALMTIDAPFTCLWAWALVAGFEAAVRGRAWAWPVAGLFIALGILAKPTMVLWIPCFAAFLVFNPATPSLSSTTQFQSRRRLSIANCRLLLSRLGRGDFWLLVGVAFLGAVPILGWNACHDWVMFRHTADGHVGLGAKKLIYWTGPLNYLGTQAGLLFVYWFIAWAAAMWRYRPWTPTRQEERYLWWMSAPIFVFFALFSLKNGGGEPNWPIVCYLSGCILSVGWFAELLASPNSWLRRGTVAGVAFIGVLGLTASLIVQFPRHCQPLFAAFVSPATPEDPAPIRRVDPTCRLRGWKYLGDEVAKVRLEVPDALIAAAHWTFPGEIAFYIPDHPTVYTFGPALNDRHSQYDLWRPNPLADVERFRGKTFIVVGSNASLLSRAFEQVEPTRMIEYREGEHVINLWTVTICRGFRGFEQKQKNAF